MPTRKRGRLVQHLREGLFAIVVIALLGACGPLGDDDTASPTATPPPRLPAASPVVELPSTPASSPQASPVASPGASPVASPKATPGTSRAVASPPAVARRRATATPRPTVVPVTPEIVTVSDCSPPEDVPAADSDAPLRVQDAVVNLRSAPGTDCEILQQLTADTVVTPLSAPVRADDLLWILVDVDGVEGWVASQYLGQA